MNLKNSSELPISYIKYPLITEKSTNITKTNNSYSFIIDKKADKITIKSLIEFIYDVKVESIRTCHLPPKKAGFKRLNHFKPHYKKAIVKLAKNNEIAFYKNTNI